MNAVIAWVQRDVRHHVATVLGMVWIVSIVRFPSLRTVLVPLVAVAVGLAFDAIVFRRKGIRAFPSSALVTALLVGLNLPPDRVVPIVVAVLIALGSKLVQRHGRHLFNPAALGVVVSGLLFRAPAGWWAASDSWFPTLIVVVGMIPVLNRLRRLWLPVTFLAVYIVWLIAVTGGVRIVPSILIDGSVMLFAFVMLPEPMTSPVAGHWRFTFGALVGVLVIVLHGVLRHFPLPLDLFLGSLLLGDLVSGVLRWKPMFRRPTPAPIVAP